jgi:serine/threonine protein phosphatase PrpC
LNKTGQNNQNFKNYLVGMEELKDTAKNLVSYAYNEGSDDNITIVLCTIGDLEKQKIELKKYNYPPCEDKAQIISFFKKWFGK